MKNTVFYIFTIGCAVLIFASAALVTAQTPQLQATNRQVRSLLNQIGSKTQAFQTTVGRNANNGRRPNEELTDLVQDLATATGALRSRVDSRQSSGEEASNLLNKATLVDRFVSTNRSSTQATTQWRGLRADLDTLATYYHLSWNWNGQDPVYAGRPSATTASMDRRMTGTYRLNAAQSDSVVGAIDRAFDDFPPGGDRSRVRQNLERRLRSPEMIAIQRQDRTVSIASSNAPQVTFEADGIARTETNPRGRTVTTTATANNEGVLIGYEGDRMNDFHVTFAPSGNRQLKVSRRIYLEDTDQAITVASVYDKTNNNPQWASVNNGSSSTIATRGNFHVANGTRIDTTLRETIDTRSSKAGDRFTMDVTSPGQYRGAVIQGTVGEASNSGRLSGRANISLDFDTISMNGKTYQFAGLIESVTAANGDTVSVNNEGSVSDSSQTTQTAIRTGIGAVLGTVIGAIAGGGKGAAVGAAVGGGAGAGSVIITGRDSIELGAGSAFRISASAPSSVGINR